MSYARGDAGEGGEGGPVPVPVPVLADYEGLGAEEERELLGLDPLVALPVGPVAPGKRFRNTDSDVCKGEDVKHILLHVKSAKVVKNNMDSREVIFKYYGRGPTAPVMECKISLQRIEEEEAYKAMKEYLKIQRLI